MQEQLISFETAKLAKEKGIDVKSRYYYTEEGIRKDSSSTALNWYSDDGYCYCPTQSLLRKRLREIHNVDMIIKTLTGDVKGVKNYAADVYIFGTRTYVKCSRKDSWEEALEIGLQEAHKLI